MLQAAFAAQRRAYDAYLVPRLRERVAELRTLRRFIVENREALVEAVNADYGNRSRHETLFGRNLAGDRRHRPCAAAPARLDGPQRRGVDWRNFLGARNRVIPQPLGMVGAIVPWNFPINLMLLRSSPSSPPATARW